MTTHQFLNKRFNDRVSSALLITFLPIVGAPLFGADVTLTIKGAGATLLRQPADVSALDVYWGPGGKEHAPKGQVFTFVKEDLNGTNPKYDVTDQDGVKWKIKLGAEAKPETAATRLVWAAGYSADEDYFLRDVTVEELPAHLRRGGKLIEEGGVMHDVRLKREQKGDKKKGSWKWKDDPFTGSRELNGLRVLMALINDWDLKDDNNEMLEDKKSGGTVYFVKDLGASFGATSYHLSQEKAKGNLDQYARSRFITHTSDDSVSFATPGPPPLFELFLPRDLVRRWRMQRIARNIPREDAKWIGGILGQLSASQIADAFRAAGYSDAEVDGFTKVVEKRIADLNAL